MLVSIAVWFGLDCPKSDFCKYLCVNFTSLALRYVSTRKCTNLWYNTGDSATIITESKVDILYWYLLVLITVSVGHKEIGNCKQEAFGQEYPRIYRNIKSVPRSKHTPSRLYKPVS